jgi:hypothetical protein
MNRTLQKGRQARVFYYPKHRLIDSDLYCVAMLTSPLENFSLFSTISFQDTVTRGRIRAKKTSRASARGTLLDPSLIAVADTDGWGVRLRTFSEHV